VAGVSVEGVVMVVVGLFLHDMRGLGNRAASGAGCLLDEGKIERLVTALRSLRHTNAEVVEKIRTEAEYFEKETGRCPDAGPRQREQEARPALRAPLPARYPLRYY
jgi:hypothetical protein